MRCPACAGEPGATHTCPGSGLAVAVEAHDAGAVLPAVEEPTFDVHLDFRVHGPQEDAQELVDALTATLAQHPLVDSPVVSAVIER